MEICWGSGRNLATARVQPRRQRQRRGRRRSRRRGRRRGRSRSRRLVIQLKNMATTSAPVSNEKKKTKNPATKIIEKQIKNKTQKLSRKNNAQIKYETLAINEKKKRNKEMKNIIICIWKANYAWALLVPVDNWTTGHGSLSWLPDWLAKENDEAQPGNSYRN